MNGPPSQNNGYQTSPPPQHNSGFNQFPTNSGPYPANPTNQNPNMNPTQFNSRPPLPPQRFSNNPGPGRPLNPVNGPGPGPGPGSNSAPPIRFAEGRGRGAFGKIAAETSLREQERARMAIRPPPSAQPMHQMQQPPYPQQPLPQQSYQPFPPNNFGRPPANGFGLPPAPGPGPLNAYNQPPPPPPFVPQQGFDRPPQNAPYQSGGPPHQYASPPHGQAFASGYRPASDGPRGFEQGREGFGYAASEAGSSSGKRDREFHGRDGPRRDGPPPGVRRNERENADRNKMIDERISKEKPCRTLFVRNVTFEADVAALERTFRSYGDVKRFYEMVRNRGMIFVTYFDTRAASTARDAQHGQPIMGRPIDVHYSLPQEEDTTGRADRDKNNGTIMLTLKGNRPLNRGEVARAFERFGDIKELRDVLAPETKVVEYYDARAAIEAYDRMNDMPFQGSILSARFVWDDPEITRRDKKGGDQREIDRERRRVSDLRDREIARARGDDRARSPDRTYRRESFGDRGPPSGVPAEEAEKLRKAKEIERLLNGIGNIPPPAPPTARPPIPTPSFQPSTPTGFNQNGYNATPTYGSNGAPPFAGQGYNSGPNGYPAGAATPSMPDVRPPYQASNQFDAGGYGYRNGYNGPPPAQPPQNVRPPPPPPVVSSGYINPAFRPQNPTYQPAVPQSGNPARPPPPPQNISTDLLGMLARSTGTAGPGTPSVASASGQNPAASVGSGSGGGGKNETEAMSNLLALLVAQSNKT